jgi:predicted RNase H-like HicB family nuclease
LRNNGVQLKGKGKQMGQSDNIGMKSLNIAHRFPLNVAGVRCEVIIKATALLQEEEGEYYVYGVKPAACAGEGKTEREAVEDLKEGYEDTALEIADESATYDAFVRGYNRFFNEKGRGRLIDIWRQLGKSETAELEIRPSPGGTDPRQKAA